jgi:nucleoside-triphosphatase THEP1
MADGKILILTGGRGAGKTALCQRLAFQARKAGWDTAGVFSPAVFENGVKTGIGIKDPRSGEQRLLALRLPPEKILPGGLGWDFDPAAFAWGNELLEHACPCDLLVVDELGPLELVRGEGWQKGIAALNSGAYRLGLAVIRPELLDTARRLWQAAEVVEVPQPDGLRELTRRLAARFLPDLTGGKPVTDALDFLGRLVTVEIDRPLGSRHPKGGFMYLVNYGFVPGTMSPDGGALDVYVLGVTTPLSSFEGRCIAVIQRRDDDDDKLVLVPDGNSLTDEEILTQTHFQEQLFQPVVVRSRETSRQC